jgi:hypothetical protein
MRRCITIGARASHFFSTVPAASKELDLMCFRRPRSCTLPQSLVGIHRAPAVALRKWTIVRLEVDQLPTSPCTRGHTYSIRIEWSRDESRPTIDGQFMDLQGTQQWRHQRIRRIYLRTNYVKSAYCCLLRSRAWPLLSPLLHSPC